jgi:hypothetical protein
MRTKITFLAAAALAAGLATSQAQSNVYSVNIVGYINVPLTTQKTLLENPLDNGTNTLVSIDNGAIPNGSSVNIWNGTGFSGATKAKGSWNSNLSIPAGIGFFVTPFSACTVTFIGQAPASNNYALGTTKSMLGAVIPIAGVLTDSGANTLNLGTSLPNGSSINIWNGTGFSGATKAKGSWNSNLSIPVAGGFFVTPFSATTWKQYLQ